MTDRTCFTLSAMAPRLLETLVSTADSHSIRRKKIRAQTVIWGLHFNTLLHKQGLVSSL